MRFETGDWLRCPGRKVNGEACRRAWDYQVGRFKTITIREVQTRVRDDEDPKYCPGCKKTYGLHHEYREVAA